MQTPEWAESDKCQKCGTPFFWNMRSMWTLKTLGVRQVVLTFIMLTFICTSIFCVVYSLQTLTLILHINSAPRYLCDYCIPVANVAARSQLRSASRHQVVVPRYNTSTFGRRAFSVAGPTVWNSLPDKLHDPSLSIDSFRRQLKTFLFAD